MTGSKSQPSLIKRSMQSDLYADRFSKTLFFDRTVSSFLSVIIEKDIDIKISKYTNQKRILRALCLM